MQEFCKHQSAAHCDLVACEDFLHGTLFAKPYSCTVNPTIPFPSFATPGSYIKRTKNNAMAGLPHNATAGHVTWCHSRLVDSIFFIRNTWQLHQTHQEPYCSTHNKVFSSTLRSRALQALAR
jgi:hypothetical protein